MYAIEKIMTDFPNKTARINCRLLTLESPATTFITEEGEKGKHNKMNKGPNPRRSTHEVMYCTCLLRLSFTNNFLSPKVRMRKKTEMEPSEEPSQE